MRRIMAAVKLDERELPHLIIGACMEVHRHLGRGLMIEAYKDCLAHELRMREIVYRRDHPLPILYKGSRVESGFQADFLVEGCVLVTTGTKPLDEEVKERMRHTLQLTAIQTGILLNFHVEHLRDGVKRIIVADQPPPLHYVSRETPERFGG